MRSAPPPQRAPKKETMRRVASAPSGNLRSGSLLPLQRRDSPRMKPSPQRWARLTRNAPRLCGFLIVLLVIARTFVLPQAVRSERSEHPDAFHADKVSCPRWYDQSSGATIKTPRGDWKVGKHHKPRVFLYSVFGSSLESTRLAKHFLDFYVRRAGIAPERIHVTVHASHENDEHAQTLQNLLDKNSVHYDLWIGTFTSETKAWHRDKLTQKTLDKDDWLIVADVDELHQFPGVKAHDGSATVDTPSDGTAPVDAFLAHVAERGANYVLAAWEDRVAEGGHLNHIQDKIPLERQFPLRCRMTEWTTPEKTSLITSFLPKAEDHKVIASRNYLKVHRSAHKIRWASYWEASLRYVTFGLRGVPWPTVYVPRSHGGPFTAPVSESEPKMILNLTRRWRDRGAATPSMRSRRWRLHEAALGETTSPRRRRRQVGPRRSSRSTTSGSLV